jgi:hypothetical protein
MSDRRFARLVVAALLLGSVADAAAAEVSEAGHGGNPCFDIIEPKRYAQPPSPVLFNRCTGESWILVQDHTGKARRFSRASYRWAVLERDGTPAAQAAAPRPETPDAGRKCFVFTGRRFCE